MLLLLWLPVATRRKKLLLLHLLWKLLLPPPLKHLLLKLHPPQKLHLLLKPHPPLKHLLLKLLPPLKHLLLKLLLPLKLLPQSNSLLQARGSLSLRQKPHLGAVFLCLDFAKCFADALQWRSRSC